MAAGKKGFVLSKRPKTYKLLPQQKRLLEAKDACNIHKGMKREDLVQAMTVCIPEFFAKKKEEAENGG